MADIQNPIPPPKKHVWRVFIIFLLLAGFLFLMSQGLRMARHDPIAIGQKLPDITLTTFDQSAVKMTDFQDKVILINFWASWCQPCEQEAAELEQAWLHYKPEGDVIFLGVDYVDTETEALQYMQKFKITYPNGPDLRTSIANRFRIRGVPETYIFDRSGTLSYLKIGPFSSADEIIHAIDPLLK